jgi:Bacterial archaeo-eukaryotic release factor family 8
MHTDIPTRADLEQLLSVRGVACVSIYLPTAPEERGGRDRLEFKNLAAEALEQLTAASIGRDSVNGVRDAIGGADLSGRQQAVAHGRGLRSLSRQAAVAERDLPPGGLRARALAERRPPGRGLARRSADRSPDRRIQGSEGQKVRLRQYARRVEEALRPTLTGLDLPLILAGSEPLESIFRSVNTYPQLARAVIAGNPDTKTDAELADASRRILDELYAGELSELRALYEQRAPRPSVRSTPRSWTSTRPCPGSSTRRTAR